MYNINDFISEFEIIDVLNKYVIHRNHKHEESVKHVALTLFDNLCSSFQMPMSDRNLLAAGAMLHDIGYFINRSDHHLHSKYLIQNDTLLDCLPNTIRYELALLCENHRKSHLNLENLSTDNYQRLLKLTAILRIADALDHEHVNSISFKALAPNDYDIKILINSATNTRYINKLTKKSALFSAIFKINILDSVLNI